MYCKASSELVSWMCTGRGRERCRHRPWGDRSFSCSLETWRKEVEQHTASTQLRTSHFPSNSKCTCTSLGWIIDPHIKVGTRSALFNVQGLNNPVLQFLPFSPCSAKAVNPLWSNLLSALSSLRDKVYVCQHECLKRTRHIKHPYED